MGVRKASATFKSLHISVSINRPAAEVYAFASDPRNLPRWAAGLSGSIRNVVGDWIAESPMGSIKIKFADQNEFGVLDHEVTLPSGEKVYTPLRVFPNSEGSEVVFTLYRRAGVKDDEFDADADMVQKDLNKLKAILEK
jgi:hypothetical protein